jgi:hypothetical protein
MVDASRDDEIISRLDRIIAILHIAFKEQINESRNAIAGDQVSSAILANTSGNWVDSGELQAQLIRETGQSERTIQRRISDLIARRVLEQSGSGSRFRYRAVNFV